MCVCMCLACLPAFVSALGSHEMGRHKLPIIIIIYNGCAGCGFVYAEVRKSFGMSDVCRC